MLYSLSLYSVESFKHPIASESISKALLVTAGLLSQTPPPTISYKNDRLLIYMSTLAMITITTIFATLAISKSGISMAKLLDYSSVPSTFGTLFLCLVTNSLKYPGYHGCLCRMHMYVCNASCNGNPCYHMAGVYFGNQIIG